MCDSNVLCIFPYDSMCCIDRHMCLQLRVTVMFCVSFYMILYDVSIDMCVYKSTWFNVNDHILKQMAAPMPMTNAAQLSVSNICTDITIDIVQYTIILLMLIKHTILKHCWHLLTIPWLPLLAAIATIPAIAPLHNWCKLRALRAITLAMMSTPVNLQTGTSHLARLDHHCCDIRSIVRLRWGLGLG